MMVPISKDLDLVMRMRLSTATLSTFTRFATVVAASAAFAGCGDGGSGAGTPSGGAANDTAANAAYVRLPGSDESGASAAPIAMSSGVQVGYADTPSNSAPGTFTSSALSTPSISVAAPGAAVPRTASGASSLTAARDGRDTNIDPVVHFPTDSPGG